MFLHVFVVCLEGWGHKNTTKYVCLEGWVRKNITKKRMSASLGSQKYHKIHVSGRLGAQEYDRSAFLFCFYMFLLYVWSAGVIKIQQNTCVWKAECARILPLGANKLRALPLGPTWFLHGLPYRGVRISYNNRRL